MYLLLFISAFCFHSSSTASVGGANYLKTPILETPILITEKSGFISTPNFDSSGLNPYPDNYNASWLISVDADRIIEIKILTLDLEDDCSGRLILTDISDAKQVTFCGRSREKIDYTSRGRQLLINFIGRQKLIDFTDANLDDEWPETSGFKLLFQSARALIAKCDLASEILCRNREACFNETLICNGVDDCLDGTDEENCPGDAKIDANLVERLDANLTEKEGRDMIELVKSLPGQAKCGQSKMRQKIMNRIVGGRAAQPHSFPWMVSLRDESNPQNGPSGHFCAGSLITDQWIISASHCFPTLERKAPKTQDWRRIKILLGKHFKLLQDDHQVTRYVKNIVKFTDAIHRDAIHRDAIHRDTIDRDTIDRDANIGDYYNHDIVLIEMNARIDLASKYVGTVCLPMENVYGVEEAPKEAPKEDSKEDSKEESKEDSKEGFVTGWGETYRTGSEDVLKEASVPIFERQECEKYIEENGDGLDGSFFICAGGQLGTDTCSGDSGGPLVTLGTDLSGSGQSDLERWTLRGITSQGSDCCGCTRDQPAIYTNVHKYLVWILRTVIKFS